MPPPNYPPQMSGNNPYQSNSNYPSDPYSRNYPPHQNPSTTNQPYLPPPYVLPHHQQYQQPQPPYNSQPQYTPQAPPQAVEPSKTTDKKRKSPKAAASRREGEVAVQPIPQEGVIPAKRGRPRKNANPNPIEQLDKSDKEPQTVQSQPSIMVYPPPPPIPGEKYNPSPLFNKNPNGNATSGNPTPASGEINPRDGVQLPSMGSWAPPTSNIPSSGVRNYSNQNQAPYGGSPDGMNGNGWSSVPPRPLLSEQQHWSQDQQGSYQSDHSFDSIKPMKRERDNQDHTGPLSDPGEMEASLALAGLKRRDSAPAGKKTKKEKDDTKNASNKKGEKDGKKSCAECRRLKAKCDRVFPCSNCRRRGCALVCPEGDLSCMQGKRLVLASTEQLHERIAQLESALFQSHGKTSAVHHPLLAPEYLDGGFASLPPPPPLVQDESIDKSPKSGSHSNRSAKDHSSASSLILATPQLSAERSSSQGRMAVESLLTEDSAAPEGKREDEWAGENAAPAMIIGTVGNQAGDDLDERHQVFERLKKLLRVLPSREEVHKRAENFWNTSIWYQTILRKEEFDTIYEPAVFAPTPANPLSPHKLAVVLIVLTLDTYFEISNDEQNLLIAEYWDAFQRCFDTRFGWAASVAGVQALAVATLFVGFGWRGARASNFYWLRQMTSSAMQLGLHREPHPSLPEEEREFRRRVFHEMFTLDCLICLNHGQRTAIPIEYVECSYPKHASPLSLKKYDFMKLVKTQVIDIGCLPDSSPASQEQLDKVQQKLMQFDVSALPSFHCPLLRGDPLPAAVDGFTLDDAKGLQTTTTSMCHYKAMLYLFRPSLRRLVARLRSQPRETVVFSDADRETVSMTYRACHAITLTSYYMFRKHPKLMARCWSVWVQTFSAAVSIAALAIWCGPHVESTFIGSAYQELSEACDMIGENGSARSLGILSLLPILKALVANRYPQVLGKASNEITVSQEGEDMLFALLGGQVDGKDSSQLATASPLPAQQKAIQTTPLQEQPSVQSQTQPPQSGQGQVQNPIKPQINPYLNQNSGDNMILSQEPMIEMNPNAVPEAYAAVGRYVQPNTNEWFLPNNNNTSNGQVVLPLAHSAPMAAIPSIYSNNINSNNNNNNNNGPTRNQQIDLNEMIDNPTELWARLQTFYEPTPLYWNDINLGGIGMPIDNNVNINNSNNNMPTSLNNNNLGFVDYAGPMY
ncbi:uncharacterized protein L201_003236 [Kwoniella dendrophila CBS 6074]|uniref:Zn(2)-C6 fungal-type domain-containing protein n=1 Tax=Kwoniella dendrophila CBS 6074 TaxID=1295534 RepID=A0AAX4JS98_9TREE